MKQKNRKVSNKYNLGSFVAKNQQTITGIANSAGALSPAFNNPGLSGALSGLSMGASVGSLFPGVGTLVGGAVGLVGGAVKGILDGNAQEKAKQKAIKNTEDIRHGQVVDLIESEIDYTNDNPYGTYEDGGDVKKKKKTSRTPYKFMQDYIQSPKYKERIEGGLYWDDTDKVISDRLNRIKSADIKFVNKIPSDNNISINGEADHYNNSIKISKSPYKAKPDEVLAHELSHLSGGLNPEWDIANYVPKNAKLSNRDAREIKKRATKQNEYLSEPGEVKARLDELRYMLKRDGIYDAGTQDFNQEHLDKAFKNYAKDNPDLFQGVESEEDLIWLMNNIASTNKTNNIPIAKDGGDVNTELINIEKGELQIDPTTGKILREYKGINPETGGKYEPHKKKGKDTKHNLVTAEVDTFIITAKEGAKYKKAFENNDKLAQNTIMANIRNAKREASKKYATGGGVYKHNTGVYNPANLAYLKGQLTNNAPANNNSINYGGILDNVVNFLPSAVNMIQSRQTPNYLEYRPTSMNVGLRQKTLSNLPNEVSINPALNSITGSVNSVDRDIVGSTSNSSVSRALRQANAVSGRRAINDAYVNNNNMNNNIRMNRSNVYSNLGAQDQQRSAINSQMMLGVDTQNRQMDLAKQQQFNYGVSQLQQMAQTLRGNKLKGNRELEMIELIKQIFPNASDFLNSYGGGR